LLKSESPENVNYSGVKANYLQLIEQTLRKISPKLRVIDIEKIKQRYSDEVYKVRSMIKKGRVSLAREKIKKGIDLNSILMEVVK